MRGSKLWSDGLDSYTCGTETYPPKGAFTIDESLLDTSVGLVVGEYRKPTLTVNDGESFQSSCTYNAKSHSRKPRAASDCGLPLASGKIPLNENGLPCRNSARLWKVQPPSPGTGDQTLDCTRLASPPNRSVCAPRF